MHESFLFHKFFYFDDCGSVFSLVRNWSTLDLPSIDLFIIMRSSNIVVRFCSECSSFVLITVQKQPPEVLFRKKVFLEISQNSQENTCARASFLIKYIKKETLAQVFSCECCDISKNKFLKKTLGDCFSLLNYFIIQDIPTTEITEHCFFF